MRTKRNTSGPKKKTAPPSAPKQNLRRTNETPAKSKTVRDEQFAERTRQVGHESPLRGAEHANIRDGGFSEMDDEERSDTPRRVGKIRRSDTGTGPDQAERDEDGGGPRQSDASYQSRPYDHGGRDEMTSTAATDPDSAEALEHAIQKDLERSPVPNSGPESPIEENGERGRKPRNQSATSHRKQQSNGAATGKRRSGKI